LDLPLLALPNRGDLVFASQLATFFFCSVICDEFFFSLISTQTDKPNKAVADKPGAARPGKVSSLRRRTPISR